MNIFSKIFGTEEVIAKGTDALINAGDALVFTKEERAGHFLDLLKAYEPFKLAQRLLAIAFAVPYLLIWVISALLFMFGALYPAEAGEVAPYAAQVLTASKDLAAMNNETLGLPVALIMGFYFGGGALESFAKMRKK